MSVQYASRYRFLSNGIFILVDHNTPWPRTNAIAEPLTLSNSALLCIVVYFMAIWCESLLISSAIRPLIECSFSQVIGSSVCFLKSSIYLSIYLLIYIYIDIYLFIRQFSFIDTSFRLVLTDDHRVEWYPVFFLTGFSLQVRWLLGHVRNPMLSSAKHARRIRSLFAIARAMNRPASVRLFGCDCRIDSLDLHLDMCLS
jgi:hypothetical protein